MSIPFSIDPSHDFLDTPPHILSSFFLPQTIAIIGATEALGSVGRTLMNNLITSSFKGTLFPVNPKREQVLGITCYPNVGAIKEKIDLAIIITPAKTVPSIISECVDANIKATIVISAGFKELGISGINLEKEILARAKKNNMRIIGPNCLGLMNPSYGLNATFAAKMAIPGHTAFISQSGAMCTAVLDWSLKKAIGFSAFVSIGSMADISWGDLIDYLGNDKETDSILIYMESIGNPRSFLSAAKEVALTKPIIVIKAGRTQAAAKAAASHTGSLAGSDEVFDCALQRAGVLRVDTIEELFDMALVLANQPRPKGPKLSIITNAGGPAVLATDATIIHGAHLTTLNDSIIEKLNTFLPEAWSHSNPVDILGDASPQTYRKSVEVIATDPDCDGLLVILSPQDMTKPEECANELVKCAHLSNKPLLASWMGGESVEKGVDILNHAGIPTFSFPDNASKVFAKMWRHSSDLQNSYETPSLYTTGHDIHSTVRHDVVESLLKVARDENRTLLSEYESKKVLQAYQIPTVETLIARNIDEAISAANTLEYPIVLKLLSETITHKSDVGGVKLNLLNQKDVIKAFEEIQHSVTTLCGPEHFSGVTVQRMISLDGYDIILGSSLDEQFGPVILFGLGGGLVEVFQDKALALPPLNTTLARELMKKTKIYHALKGVRGKKPIDFLALESLISRFSSLIVEHPWIKECDINPLLVSSEEMIALDARIVLHDASLKESLLPKSSIRPYPSQYISSISLKDNLKVHLRPVKPEDEPLLVKFHHELSEETVKNRYQELLSLDVRTTHQRLIRICCGDYDRNIAIIAEIKKEEHSELIGIARLSKIMGSNDAKFTITIVDRLQNKGLGTQLLYFLINVAKQEKIDYIQASISENNHQMLKICKNLQFQFKKAKDAPALIKARLSLKTHLHTINS
ncbi:MAG: bifunctional acetate--CoA ligase family protein/GNAT family N-acetyltransferase [Chlamydiales bacterium]|nr:bifunctional acetate--CoA ligase family protein/GNAT family N-acetyltransferase [Chlamydiales bacterium]